MKKLIALVAIIGIVFSSCNGKYTIAKRKYNKGFYVSKGGSPNTKPTVAHTKVNNEVATPEVIETIVVAKTEEKTSIPPIKIQNTFTDLQPKSTSLKNEEPITASSSKTNYAPAHEIKPLNINHNTLLSTKKGSDSNLILMVILCFLWWFNLIAVYMHDGGITTNFWITLLLDFTIIGGVIFSLLVVLDVIDLA